MTMGNDDGKGKQQKAPIVERWGRCRNIDMSTMNAKGWKWAYCQALDYRVTSRDCNKCEIFNTEPLPECNPLLVKSIKTVRE
jgi:hypothetical protein